MIFAVLLLILGLILLIGSAEALVRGSSSIAKSFGISPMVIGLTVVAFGTSAPEFIVTTLSSLSGSSDIGIGNIVGSNIANILLILGVAAFIHPLKIGLGTVWREIPFALLSVVLLFIMGNDYLIDGIPQSIISRSDGLTLLSFFIIFMYYIFGIAKVEKGSGQEHITSYKTPVAIFLTAAGIAGLFFGGKLLIDNATVLARIAGLSEALIGLTIVAIGTSLPELATSVVASLKRQNDIAVGNVVGSNIFNVFWVVGISSVIAPIPYRQHINYDVLVSIVAAVVLFFAMFIGRRHTLTKFEGILFIVFYVVYLTTIIIRG